MMVAELVVVLTIVKLVTSYFCVCDVEREREIMRKRKREREEHYFV